MQLEFVAAVERDHQANREQTSGMPRQPGTRPDLAPRVARDQVLEFAIEGIALRFGPVHVRISQHYATDFHPLRVTILFVHSVPSGCDEVDQRRRERRRRFDVRQVRGGQLDIARSLDAIGKKARVRRGRRDIVRSGDHQCRRSDARPATHRHPNDRRRADCLVERLQPAGRQVAR